MGFGEMANLEEIVLTSGCFGQQGKLLRVGHVTRRGFRGTGLGTGNHAGGAWRRKRSNHV